MFSTTTAAWRLIMPWFGPTYIGISTYTVTPYLRINRILLIVLIDYLINFINYVNWILLAKYLTYWLFKMFNIADYSTV